VVSNDTFAVLRAGTERGWGVAIVCGAGINCVGVAPDGRQVRFPALGPITGDWGGGYDVGMAALAAAARSEDGRGAATSLERAVPAHFGLESAAAVGEAIHVGRIAARRVVELAPLVFEEAGRDASAAAIVDRVAAEIAAFARATLARLSLEGAEVEVALGGGLLQASGTRLVDVVAASLGPAVALRVVREPPIAGAILLGLDELGAGGDAAARVRRELAAAAPLVMEPVGVGDG
jgi:N-acetylglucosamine kinase-like BadF-type ATPase